MGAVAGLIWAYAKLASWLIFDPREVSQVAPRLIFDLYEVGQWALLLA